MQNIRAGGSDQPPDPSTERKPPSMGLLREVPRSDTSWRATLRELSVSVIALARSDVDLALNEIRVASKSAQRHALQMGVFGMIAALGILPFLAFLVVALGDLINNYWLSSLIVSLFCVGIGGIFALRAWTELKEQDFSMGETRRMLDRQFHVLEKKLMESTNRETKRRAA